MPSHGPAPDTTYYVRAYATNNVGTSYGNELKFITLNIYLPSLTTDPVLSITYNSAKSGGNIVSDGGAAVTARGVCWGTSLNPTTYNSKTSDGTGKGIYTSNITGLTSNTTYYIRAYAVNIRGTAYGTGLNFTTAVIKLPIVTTGAITDITQNSAFCSGRASVVGWNDITERGFCWGASENPTINANKISCGTDTGFFSTTISGLTSGTGYYLRAYAINSLGTAYGAQFKFVTLLVLLPVITLDSVNSITNSTAVVNANISDNGGSTITGYGVCWGTSPKAGLTGNHLSYTSPKTSFSASITGLSPSTTYFVRTYAINSSGTSFSNQLSFTTAGAVSEINSKIHQDVTIGSQAWLAENIRVFSLIEGYKIEPNQ